MNISKERNKDRFYNLKLFSSMQEIREKLSDRSLSEEERKKIWEEGLPIMNEINRLVKERKSQEPITAKMMENKLKTMEIPESDLKYWEKIVSLKEELEKFKNKEKRI